MNIQRRKLRGYKAFSLIELIVVIAIIAILASIALPSYKSYMIGVKMAAAGVIIQGMMDRSIEYSTTHGKFGNAYDLGLATSTYTDFAMGPEDGGASLSPYFAGSGWGLVFGDGGSIIGLPACGAIGYADALINPSLVGLDTLGAQVFLECDYWHLNGTIHKQCSYWIEDGVHSDTTQYIPGWVNAYSDNNYTYSSAINSNPYFNSNVVPECQ